MFSGDGGPAAAAASVDIYWRVRDIKARPFIETSLFLTLDRQPGSFVDLPQVWKVKQGGLGEHLPGGVAVSQASETSVPFGMSHRGHFHKLYDSSQMLLKQRKELWDTDYG